MNTKAKATLKKFEKYLSFRNYSETTIKTYSSYLKKFLLSFDCDPYHISTRKAEEYLLNYNYSSVSQQNQIINSVKIYYKIVLRSKLRELKIERPKKEKKLPKVIDQAFLLSKIQEINNLKHKVIISLAYSCGLRVSEVINLKITDIDSHRMLIHIKNAKGRKDRIVPLSETILSLLREYYIEFQPKDYLFNGQSKPTYSATSCNKIVKKYLGNEYHFHLLRHSGLTAMLENGTNLRIIQAVAGHESPNTTAIYAHVSTEVLKQVKQAI